MGSPSPSQDGCVDAYHEGEVQCQGSDDPCSNPTCITAIQNAADKCRGGDYGYFDTAEGEYVNVTHDVAQMQMMCSDPCMMQAIKCSEKNPATGEDTMTCREECKRWYGNLGECADKPFPGTAMTYGQLLSHQSMACNQAPSPSMWSPSPNTWSPSPSMWSPSPSMWSPSPSQAPTPAHGHSCRKSVKIPRAEADRTGAVRCGSSGGGSGGGGSSGGGSCNAFDIMNDAEEVAKLAEYMDMTNKEALCGYYDAMEDMNDKYKHCPDFSDASSSIEQGRAQIGCGSSGGDSCDMFAMAEDVQAVANRLNLKNGADQETWSATEVCEYYFAMEEVFMKHMDCDGVDISLTNIEQGKAAMRCE